MMKLYVGNLPYSVNSDSLKEHFAEFGEISDCVVIMDRDSGRSKGFGFGVVDGDKAREASLDKRRRLADEWREQIDLKGEIREAVQLLRKPTLARIATILNGKGLVSIRGSKWTQSQLTKQLQAMNIKSWRALA